MLGSEREDNGSSVLTDPAVILQHGRWTVIPLLVSLEKLEWLWAQMSGYKTLFSDLTRGDFNNFWALITQPDSYWLEVFDGENPVGIIYWTGLSDLVTAHVHVVFWDRKPMEKVELCKELARHFFRTFPHHRMEATLPAIYYSTLRLAKRIGFTEEGRKRQSQVMDGKYVDEVIFGLLPTEIKD